jgi:hypothetical protein
MTFGKEDARRVKEAASLVSLLDSDGPSLMGSAYRARLSALVEEAQSQPEPLVALGELFAGLVDGLCGLSFLLACELAKRTDKTTAQILDLYREHSARIAVEGLSDGDTGS